MNPSQPSEVVEGVGVDCGNEIFTINSINSILFTKARQGLYVVDEDPELDLKHLQEKLKRPRLDIAFHAKTVKSNFHFAIWHCKRL